MNLHYLLALAMLLGLTACERLQSQETTDANMALCRPFLGRHVVVDGAAGWAFNYNADIYGGALTFYPEAMQGNRSPFYFTVHCSRFTLAE